MKSFVCVSTLGREELFRLFFRFCRKLPLPCRCHTLTDEFEMSQPHSQTSSTDNTWCLVLLSIGANLLKVCLFSLQTLLLYSATHSYSIPLPLPCPSARYGIPSEKRAQKMSSQLRSFTDTLTKEYTYPPHSLRQHLAFELSALRYALKGTVHLISRNCSYEVKSQ